MAEIRIPAPEHMAPRRRTDPFIPFVISDEDDYLDGLNHYLQRRCSGRIDPADVTAPVLKPVALSFKTNIKIAQFLCDFRTFCETETAHPELGKISLEDVREWHILELYSNAMHRGLWSATYFHKGVAQPLDPSGTINPRLIENMRCFLWLSANGYTYDFKIEPEFEALRESLATSTTSLSSAVPQYAEPFKRNVRRSPGGFGLPSPNLVCDWLNELPRGAHRIAAIGIHEHGFRRAEICHSVLLEGHILTRNYVQLKKLNMWHHGWNEVPIATAYDLHDDLMIGVLPLKHAATEVDSPKFRIIGKNNIVRTIHLKHGWLARVEQYADTDRNICLARRKAGPRVPNLLINRDGMPLPPEALYQSFTRASERLNLSQHITPHVLRHVFACRFLQTAIEVDAHRRGYAVDELTHSQLAQYAELPLEVLRLELGHASVDTTRIYVEMLIRCWIAPRYHRAWNAVLDGAE